MLLHLLKIGLYASFGLLGRASLGAGLLVAVAAVLGSLTTRLVLPRMREALFRQIGQIAMVVAGAAMFCLSGGQLMRLHRTWIDLVAPGNERELHLYWQGRQHFAVEAESDGWLVIERTIPIEALPDAIRRRVLARIPADTIAQVEAVHGVNGLSYEIYFRQGGAPAKIEID